MQTVDKRTTVKTTPNESILEQSTSKSVSCSGGTCGINYRLLAFLIPFATVTVSYMTGDNSCSVASSLVAGGLAGLSSYSLFRFIKMMRHRTC